MRKKLTISAILICLQAFSLILISCNGDASKFEGNWDYAFGKMVFFKDKTGTWNGNSMNWRISNSPNRGRKLLTISGNDGINSFEYEFSDYSTL